MISKSTVQTLYKLFLKFPERQSSDFPSWRKRRILKRSYNNYTSADAGQELNCVCLPAILIRSSGCAAVAVFSPRCRCRECLFASTPAWRSRNCEQAGTDTTNQPCGGPEIRKSSQLTLATLWRRAISSSPGAQMTRGVNAGLRRQNSSTPRSARTSNLPVLTSMAHFPQLPSMTASISSGSSRQYVTCWPWLIAKA